MMRICMDFLYFSIFVHISHLHYLIVLRRPKNGRRFRRARRGISNFQWVAFCVYFVFAGSAPLLLGCSENGWCALASLKAAISWMSPQGKRQTWRRTLYPQDKYWCSHCCQTNTHDCHWLHTFQMYLQPHWWLFLVVILISWMSPQSNVCKQQTWRQALTAGNVHLSHLYYNIHVIIT